MARASLPYDKMFYTMYGLNSDNWTEQAMRKEYSRLRSIARKRLERFEGTEWQDSKTYTKNAGKYKPLAEISGKTELKRLLSDVAFFVDASTGSVRGLQRKRRKYIETVHKMGYKWVNTRNYKEFTQFMDEAINKKLAGMFDSEQVATVYKVARKKKISSEELFKNFTFWYANQDPLNNMPELYNKNGSTANSNAYRKALETKNTTQIGKKKMR